MKKTKKIKATTADLTKTLILRVLFHAPDRQIYENQYTLSYAGDYVPTMNTLISNTLPNCPDFRLGNPTVSDDANFIMVTGVMFEPLTAALNMMCILERQRPLFLHSNPITWPRLLPTAAALAALFDDSPWRLAHSFVNTSLTELARPLFTEGLFERAAQAAAGGDADGDADDNVRVEFTELSMDEFMRLTEAMLRRRKGPGGEQSLGDDNTPLQGRKKREVQ